MDKATKAALFSAFLIPGWGQIYLKYYKRGLAFIVPVLIGVLAMVWMIVQVGIAIIKAAPVAKGSVQISNAVRITSDALKVIDLSTFLLILILIVALWILSIIDAYQLGKKMTFSTTSGHQ